MIEAVPKPNTLVLLSVERFEWRTSGDESFKRPKYFTDEINDRPIFPVSEKKHLVFLSV